MRGPEGSECAARRPGPADGGAEQGAGSASRCRISPVSVPARMRLWFAAIATPSRGRERRARARSVARSQTRVTLPQLTRSHVHCSAPSIDHCTRRPSTHRLSINDTRRCRSAPALPPALLRSPPSLHSLIPHGCSCCRINGNQGDQNSRTWSVARETLERILSERSAPAAHLRAAALSLCFSSGGPDKLVLDTVILPPPKPTEVLIALEEAGVNYIDTYHRTGLYKLPMPATIGREGAGVVQAVGADVKTVAVGDRVVFFAGGAYATHALVDASVVVRIADGLSFKDAVAAHVQGLTAHAFTTDAYRVKAGDFVLIHAAAGGTGNLLLQMCKIRGATVIATVGSEDKAALAKAAGADYVINYSTQNFSEEVRKIVPAGVHAVYDGVGAATFEGSLKSLRKRGTMITFGNASGPVPAVEPLTLTAHGSIFLTRPTVAHFVEQRSELEARTKEIHEWILSGKLQLRIAKEYALAEAKQAHEALESRKFAGKILLNIKA